jgi:branched-subunit amino acid aminotransferase/4-amino-4-deoxychorismate lyase
MIAGYILNGTFVSGDRLTVELGQPYFAHGQGLFETLRVFRGRPLFLRTHMERMRTTARLLELSGVPETDAVGRDIETLARRLGLEHTRTRLQLLCRDDGAADFLITAEPVAALAELGEPIALGLAAPIFARGIAMAGLKTMNYMANRLAETEGRARGFDEVAFTLPDGTLLEGTRTSIFAVRQGALWTPPLDLPILPGVTRAAVLHVARRAGIEVREAALHVRDLAGADEAFVTGSISGIRPLRRFESRDFAGPPGAITRRVAAAHWQLLEGGEDLP